MKLEDHVKVQVVPNYVHPETMNGLFVEDEIYDAVRYIDESGWARYSINLGPKVSIDLFQEDIVEVQ